MWFDLRPEEEPSRLMDAPGRWKSAQGVTLGCSYTSERGSWTQILYPSFWAGGFLQSLPSFFWCLWKHGVSRVVEALNPKVRGNCQSPHSSKGGTCGRSENFSGEPLELPWHLGCHCHHPSSLLLGHRLILPVEWCWAGEQDQTPADCQGHCHSWLWTLAWRS